MCIFFDFESKCREFETHWRALFCVLEQDTLSSAHIVLVLPSKTGKTWDVKQSSTLTGKRNATCKIFDKLL